MLDHCIYCGDWYQCRDHVIPINYQKTYRDFVPGSTVKCCTECNSLLGDRAHHTIQARAKYLVKAYIKNRKKFLNFPEWEREEIRELGYNLGTGVQTGLAKKWLYLMKLDNLERVGEGYECRPFRYQRKKDEIVGTSAEQKKCLGCRTAFYNVTGSEFCSEYCNSQHKVMLVTKAFPLLTEEDVESRLLDRQCLVCALTLRTTNKRAYFCSKACLNALNKVISKTL
jgi:hypothetical protein